MAAFAVVFDGTRVNNADAVGTVWTAETATPGAEVDFFYQGTASISAQIKTSESGFYHTSSSIDMTTPKVAVMKIIATNKDVLDGNGMVLRFGSATTAYYQYNNVFSASTYPIAGGWQVVCIDPNVSQWRSSTTGSPNLAAVIYWAIRADFSATSKVANVGCDAIDHVNLGNGLTGTAGDGASADGKFSDFVTADEGTVGNRWGIVQTRGGVLYVNGVLTIGSSGTATEFTDSNQVLVFPHHRVTNGFCGIDFNIQNASTVLSAKSCFLSGRGDLFTSDDTRPDYTIVGTSGTLDVTGSTFQVFRQIDWNNKVTALNTQYINGLKVVGDGADLRGATFSGCTGAADISYLFWNVATDPDGKFDDASFTKGTTATHAIEFGTSSPTTMTLRRVAFSGYNASNAQNDSTLYIKRTSGTVTINLIGCTGNISYKTDGATVTLVVDPVTLSVTCKDAAGAAIQNAQVAIIRTSDKAELMNELTDVNGLATESYSGALPAAVTIRARKSTSGTRYIPETRGGTITTSGLTVQIDMRVDTVIT